MIRVFSDLIWLPAIIMLAGPVAAACVENATSELLYFTVESRTDQSRIGAALVPGAKLCLPGTSSAVFRAFAAENSVEGCSRFSGPDGRDRLLQFLPPDNCRWASHGG